MNFAGNGAQGRAWLLCFFLFAATTLNYLDRQTVSLMAPAMQKELRIDNASLGLLFSAFYYAYTFAQFGVGALLDRWSLRWVFGAAVLAWSLAAGMTALAHSFFTLLMFRMLLGIAESANWPAAMRIVARALPPEERALGNGIFTSGTSVGALIAPALILGAAGAAGWRGSFVAVAALGLVWFLAWVPFTGRHGFDRIWRSEIPPARAGAAYRALLRSGPFWRVFVVSVLVNPCLYFNLNWLPTYFSQQRGIAPGRELGTALTVIYLGLDSGYLCCGFAVRLLARRMPLLHARRAVFTLASGLMCISALVPALADPAWAIGALSVVNMAIGVWIAMYLTMAQEVSETHVSTAAGLLGGMGSLAGALAMWWVGEVSKKTGSFALPLIAVTAAGLVACIAGYRVQREPAEVSLIGAGS
jgi:ACS family hexuronate transporter-like MFS transporter